MNVLRSALVFLRLVDRHAPDEVSLTNTLILFSMALTGYSVFRSGTLDIVALVALMTAVFSYDRKRVRAARFVSSEADRAATVARLEAAEAKLAALVSLQEDIPKLKEKMIALSNRVGGR